MTTEERFLSMVEDWQRRSLAHDTLMAIAEFGNTFVTLHAQDDFGYKFRVRTWRCGHVDDTHGVMTEQEAMSSYMRQCAAQLSKATPQ